MSKGSNTLNQQAAKPSRSVLFGAAFLMATSAIGPGFLTQTSKFTAQFGTALSLVIVLAIVSVVVISNTIRLTVFARRKEINIMKFVGATNAFIRLPFFVEGMTVGAISGVLATVVVGGAYYGLEQALLQPEALWLNEFTKCMWPFMDIIWPLLGGFVLFGVAIGGVGCASSIRKHLKV